MARGMVFRRGMKRISGANADIERLFCAAEAELGVSLTVGDHAGRLRGWLHAQRIKHDLPACLSVKRVAEAPCLLCEARERLVWLQNHPDGFVKICHAGWAELVAPLWPDIPQAASLAAGLFLWKDVARRIPVERQRLATPHRLAKLPALTEKRANTLLPMLRCLAAAIREWYARQTEIAPADHSRKEFILAFVQANFRRKVALTELSTALHLSEGRAGHLVREACGASFVALVKQARLSYAKHLLEGSSLPVAEISRIAGFPEPRQLHVAFRASEAMTPRQWRLHRGAYAKPLAERV